MPDFSVAGPVACHLGASCVLEDAGGLRVTECPVATGVGEVVTTEFVVDSHVESISGGAAVVSGSPWASK